LSHAQRDAGEEHEHPHDHALAGQQLEERLVIRLHVVERLLGIEVRHLASGRAHDRVELVRHADPPCC